MHFHFKKGWVVGLMLVMGMLWPAYSRADSGYDPTQYGGNFGLGLELGDPGTWGVSGKVWIDRNTPRVGRSGGAFLGPIETKVFNTQLRGGRDFPGERRFYIINLNPTR